MPDRRVLCLNCMDGRVQLPVLQWIKDHHGVDFVDVVTEAGMDSVLADAAADVSFIIRSIKISLEINKASVIFIVGHHDCRGNPVDKALHINHIKKAVARIQALWKAISVIGLWVNEKWQVEAVA